MELSLSVFKSFNVSDCFYEYCYIDVLNYIIIASELKSKFKFKLIIVKINNIWIFVYERLRSENVI